MKILPARNLQPGHCINIKPESGERAEIVEVRAVNGSIWIDLDNDDVLFFKPFESVLTWDSKTGEQ